ncbi:MAG: tetratricopeptide repeat protein [Candidatus Omnitrophica bacterium]|nr:tetratricopeptide repeat protein [Candidatus Omnitrophota bacterium]MCF7878768.1 tetratricopeptide repeat protein [Candidatus Omnitrophota bacterium]
MKSVILILVLILLSFLSLFYYQLTDSRQLKISGQEDVDIAFELESIYQELASIHLSKRRHQKAIDLYKKALNINPDSPQTWYKLGRAYIELKDYQKAIGCYRQVLKIDPGSIIVLNDLGWVYEVIGNYQKSIEYFQKYLRYNPDDPEIYFKLGIVYLEAEDLPKAKEKLAIAKKLAKKQGKPQLLSHIEEVLKKIGE